MTQRRVSFAPAGLIFKRVVALIKRADEAEKAVVLKVAGGNLATIFVILKANAGFIVSAVGDQEHQRLPAAFRAGAHHFNDCVCFVLVNLINQRAVRTWTRLSIVRTDGLEERTCLQKCQVPYIQTSAGFGDTLRQRRRLIHHRHRIAEQDHRLVFLGGRCINFGSGFFICHQQIKPHAARQRRLPGALTGFDVTHAKTAGTVGTLPAKQRSNNKALPRQKNKWLPFVLAAVQLQHPGKEINDPTYCFNIPEQPPSRTIFQIANMTRAGIPNIRPCKYLPRCYI